MSDCGIGYVSTLVYGSGSYSSAYLSTGAIGGGSLLVGASGENQLRVLSTRRVKGWVAVMIKRQSIGGEALAPDPKQVNAPSNRLDAASTEKRGPRELWIDGGVLVNDAEHTTVPSFWLDQTEVTVGQYRSCVQVGGCSDPGSTLLCNWNRTERLNHPVNCVDPVQAQDFCEWAGKRLPTEDEWAYAAQRSILQNYRDFLEGGEDPSEVDCYRQEGTCEVRSPTPAEPGVQGTTANVAEWTSSYGQPGYVGMDLATMSSFVIRKDAANSLAANAAIGLRFWISPSTSIRFRGLIGYAHNSEAGDLFSTGLNLAWVQSLDHQHFHELHAGPVVLWEPGIRWFEASTIAAQAGYRWFLGDYVPRGYVEGSLAVGASSTEVEYRGGWFKNDWFGRDPGLAVVPTLAVGFTLDDERAVNRGGSWEDSRVERTGIGNRWEVPRYVASPMLGFRCARSAEG